MQLQALEGVGSQWALRLSQGCFRHTAPHWLCQRSKVRGPARPAAKPGSVGRVCGWLAGKAGLGAEAGGGFAS